MKLLKLVLIASAISLTAAAYAKDDEAQCKKNVDAFIDGQRFLNQHEAANRIEKARKDGASNCDLQQALIGIRSEEMKK